MSIDLVDFGRLDAEADRNLQTYFVDTGVLGRLATGARQFVMGRKGSGKTALFTAADQSRLSRDVIAVEFADYPWQSHKLVRDEGALVESAYVSSWRFTFLVLACRHWAANAQGEVKDRAQKHLKDIYGDEEPGLLEALFDKLKSVRKLNLPQVHGYGGGGIEFGPEPAGPLLAKSVVRWCQLLESFVAENFRFFPFTLKLDRLDEGWDATTEAKGVVAGVLKAARDLNLRLAEPRKPPPVLTFLRSDIFFALQFNDKNKMSADVEYLDWSEDRLVEVVEQRIGKSLGRAPRGAWDSVFSTQPMRQRASIKSYMLKRTMMRPRDLLAFCIECQNVAVSKGQRIVETADVYEAEKAYSRHIYDELDDEMHKQVPEGRECLQALREIARTKFTLADWLAAPRVKRLAPTDDQARAYLKILFDYSVVGVPRRGGVGGGTTYQFNYHDRLLEPDFDQDITVHPSLKKHLSLADARRDLGDADPEEDES